LFALQTFGTVGLRIRGEIESQVQIVQPKRLALLIYLAAAPLRRCRRRDQMVGMFWPDLDQEHARGALSQALRYLRRTLGEGAVITQGDEEAGLDRKVVECDAVSLGVLCDAGKFEEAVDLYKGPFLDGFLISDASPEYEQWVAVQRTVLRRHATGAALTLTERAERAGDLAAAVRWARRATEVAPGDEAVTACLIRLLDQAGDRAGALRTYEELRERLREEFQVAPSHDIQALIARILGR